MNRRSLIVSAAALAAGCAARGGAAARPIVIAHRGASGERPEHTAIAYELAARQGADYIEPDLVMSKDGVLVCRHETEISGTTDVASHPEFAARRTAKLVDGVQVEGWFAEDFSLAELKTLRCRERLPQLRPPSAAFDGRFDIPTFEEVIALARRYGVGLYPELKHPSDLRAQGLDPLAAFIPAVRAAGGQALADRMFVQCFEIGPLEQLAQMSSIRWRCVQLIAADAGPFDRPGLTPAGMLSSEGLARIRGYADGIGVEKTLIVPRDSEGRSTTPTDLIDRAHAANLIVHGWTYRAENAFLPRELRNGASEAARGDLAAELAQVYALGIDGVFTDFPELAVAARS